MITAENVSKHFKSHADVVCALDQVSATIDDGDKVAIVGKSGSGKTTFLNMLSGLDRPTSGRLIVDGKELGQLSPDEMAEYRLKSIGVIFQSFQLIGQRTAAQNIELPLIIRGMPKNERTAQVELALQKVGLQHRAKHFPYQLSGGEQQRVAIARAIVKKPAVILADEPTGNLDSGTSTEIMNLLMQICRDESLTMVLITHDLELAARYADRHLEMSDGKLAEKSEFANDRAGS